MKPEARESENIPKRIEILKTAFEEGWNLEKVNSELERNFCEKLYARNRYEAGMIYAFEKGLSYEEWKSLYSTYREAKNQKRIEKTQNSKECLYEWQEKAISEDNNPKTTQYGNGIWSGREINLKQIKEYIEKNSQKETMQTGILTAQMESELRKVGTVGGFTNFQEFMIQYEEKFSAVREKTRYYFCKYLYFYIEERCQRYYVKCEEKERAVQEGKEKQVLEYCRRQEKNALLELDMLKNLSVLKEEADRLKSKLNISERKEYLEGAGLSYRVIFDRFNYFYFDFITLESVEYLLECHWRIFEQTKENEDPAEKNLIEKTKREQEKLKVAHVLGYCKENPTPKQKEKAFLKLEKLKEHFELREEKLDKIYSLDLDNPGSQAGRSGENYFRGFITGKRDIDRDTLIAFLLFVDGTTFLEAGNKITLPRLNRILMNCGFAQLEPNEREFDKFIRGYLTEKNREEKMNLLCEAAQEAVERGEDFCLYKIYLQGKSKQEELLKYLDSIEKN